MPLPTGKIVRVAGKALVIAAAEAAREIVKEYFAKKKTKRSKV